MYKELSTIETKEKQEVIEDQETIGEIESSEELLVQSEKEVSAFQQENGIELAQVESQAEKDGLVIDQEDRNALLELNREADIAKAELSNDITVASSPKMPPPLPEEYLQKISLKEKVELTVAQDLADKYIQKSKIVDKDEALQKLMAYTGTNSREELEVKLKEKDEDGYSVIEMLTPDSLFDESAGTGISSPSLETLKKIRNCGNALGYTYVNTPEYKSRVDDMISRLIRKGKDKEALEVEKIFEEEKNNFEKEKEKSEFQKIDEDLVVLFKDKEKFKKYIEEKKNLPPDAIVYLYHGLGSGGYDSALKVINGSSHGIEQHSGPTLSLAPVGQFWRGIGFRYALRRDQIEFPGENNPNAVVRMQENDFGDYGDGVITHGSGSLPIDQFEAEVMRSEFVLPNPGLEKEIVEKMHTFSETRAKRGDSK
ncbi:MAG: hypothetical protein ACD_11C00017G0030 [uncultured bacterium]|nr:MAG: hypothetical protein ACD_11C00017G0030 [uncultured bacterium]HBR71516.1 hypothetical protein [Candidatus Moranbacteria bacterium]